MYHSSAIFRLTVVAAALVVLSVRTNIILADEVSKLWKEVAEVNRVWLAPFPEQVSYTVTARPTNNARITESVNRVWIDGEKARWEMDVRSFGNDKLRSSHAFVIMDGIEVYLRGPHTSLSNLSTARENHALNQGISWSTAMHAVYWDGLPKGAEIIEQRRDVAVLELDLGKKRCSVGLGLFHSFKGGANFRIDRVRLHINTADMTPIREEYIDRSFGIEYPEDFLEYGEQRAPTVIQLVSKNFRDDSDWILEARFRKFEDDWILEKALNIQNGRVAIAYVLDNLSTDEIDPNKFSLTQR